MRTAILITILFWFAAGCHSYEQRVYEVSVRNESSGPITIWLTKDGPPFETGWLSPEDIATESPSQPAKVIGGVVVMAGKTAETGAHKGQFEPRTQAVLRVYGGQLNFDQLLAASGESKNRVDHPLHPGRNNLIVTGSADVPKVDEAP